MQHEDIQTKWQRVRDSIWFTPSSLVIVSMILPSILLWIDSEYADLVIRSAPWLFSGTPDAARGFLSTIASSLITVISISFSVTIIALQQATNQYSPRLLRTFIADKGNQIVLGTYIGTYIYSLLVLRAVRTPEGGAQGFVPALSISVAFLLALICLFLLIFFIHQLTQTLQVSTTTRQIHKDIVKHMDHLFPEKVGKKPDRIESKDKELKDMRDTAHVTQIQSDEAGLVRKIDLKLLQQLSSQSIRYIYISIQTGDFVIHKQKIGEVGFLDGTAHDTKKGIIQDIRHAIIIHAQRTIEQDILFGIRQLVDIAIKALSPSINDPTTAQYCIGYLGDVVVRLTEKELPRSIHRFEGNPVTFVFHKYTWNEYIELAFGQIRRAAASDLNVTETLVDTMGEIYINCEDDSCKNAIKKQFAMINRVITSNPWDNENKQMIESKMEDIL